jgi:hypothetical protein
MPQDAVPAPPAPAPVLAPAPAPTQITTTVAGQPVTGSPRAIYQAVREKREVLGDQMNRLLNRRENVVEQLHSGNVDPAERAALEQHLTEVNARIIAMEKTLHAADAEVAAAAGVPGASVPERVERGGGNNEEAMAIGAAFMGIAIVIIAIAWARRLWKGATNVVAKLPAEFEARFARMEDSLDAVAIEVERVSEGQRFLSKVFSDPSARALGVGAAQPIETRAEAKEPVHRG